MEEKTERFTTQFNNFISENPHYGWLIIAAGLGFLCVGYILRWKWVLNPEGRTRSVVLYEALGEETMRIIMIVCTGLVTLMGIIFFWLGETDSAATQKNTDNTNTSINTEINQ
ncbi:immunity 17 family protein [Mariniflexile ostreae]|uniref:Immunity 17 family protein n=1 Tax=Mariniflexile ostreae TaxID=1520892 RepID=A0ABV5FB27_9FLAO